MTTPKPVTAYAAVSPGSGLNLVSMSDSKSALQDAILSNYPHPTDYTILSVTILPTEQYEAMVALCAAADAVLEETAGRKAFSSGPCGMTIEAQLRASHYRISAWAVEEIREAAAALAALKEQDHG